MYEGQKREGGAPQAALRHRPQKAPGPSLCVASFAAEALAAPSCPARWPALHLPEQSGGSKDPVWHEFVVVNTAMLRLDHTAGKTEQAEAAGAALCCSTP